jgi:hypothetical protein
MPSPVAPRSSSMAVFMRGSDIVKAMALGRNAVGIGRLQGLAAAAAG